MGEICPFFYVDQPFAAQFDENQKRRNLQTDRSFRFRSKIWQGPGPKLKVGHTVKPKIAPDFGEIT